jgi:hypothetical protein
MARRLMLCFFAVVLAVATLASCSKSHDELVLTYGPQNVGPVFIAITLPSPLQYSHKVQEIQFELADKYEVVTSPSLQMRIEPGSAFMPELQLTDSENRQYQLPATSFWGRRVVFNAPETGGAPIVRMQVRSAQPIHLERVIWFCYDPESFRR